MQTVKKAVKQGVFALMELFHGIVLMDNAVVIVCLLQTRYQNFIVKQMLTVLLAEIVAPQVNA